MKFFNFSMYIILFCLFFTVQSGKITVFYNERYNIVPPKIFKPLLQHAFDGEKYRKVFEALQSDQVISAKIAFKQPENTLSNKDFMFVHSAQYLNSLCDAQTILQIVELHGIRIGLNFLKYIPFVYQIISNSLYKLVVESQQWATNGTVQAALEAIANKSYTINLGGGFHHAKPYNGEGFCIIADIPLACKKIWEKYPNKKILVIDLDNHQGNGTAYYREISTEYRDKMMIFDIYADRGYPMDKQNRAPWINFNYPVKNGINSEEYLSLLKKELEAVIKNNKFDLIIYNAGTDIYENDPLGSMKVSKQAIIDRDLFVFSMAKKYNTPLCMVLSGGYTKESANIIAESIKNICKIH